MSYGEILNSPSNKIVIVSKTLADQEASDSIQEFYQHGSSENAIKQPASKDNDPPRIISAQDWAAALELDAEEQSRSQSPKLLKEAAADKVSK